MKMSTSLVQDSRSELVQGSHQYIPLSDSNRQVGETFHALPSIAQQAAFSSYFQQISPMQFLTPQFLAQQSLMASMFPPFYPTWQSFAPMPLISPNAELPIASSNYFSSQRNEDIHETSQVKMSSLSPMSQSDSPPPHKNNSIDIKKTAGKKKIFECKQCSKTFGYKHVLQNHEKVHTGEKSYRCDKCNKCFRRDHHLKVHMRLHSGEKPYLCTFPMCGRQFVQVANLRRHLKTHEQNGLQIHEKMLCTEEKENLWAVSASSEGSLMSSKSSEDHEDIDLLAYRMSRSYRFESPEQTQPEDLSTKSR